MMTASLANSLGWKVTGPSSSQRLAPLRSMPMPGMSTASRPRRASTIIGTAR